MSGGGMGEGLRLVLVSRRIIPLTLALIGLAAITRLLGTRSILLGEGTPVPLPWALLVPAVSAYLVAGTSPSPVPWLEALACRRIDLIALGLLLANATLAIALLIWSTAPLPPPLSTPAAVRAFVGLLGVSLATVALVGPTLGWIVPAGLTFCAVFLLSGRVPFLPIDWLVQADGHAPSWVIALALGAAGLAVASSGWFRRRAFDN